MDEEAEERGGDELGEVLEWEEGVYLISLLEGSRWHMGLGGLLMAGL